MLKVPADRTIRYLFRCLPFLMRTDVLEHADIVITRCTHLQLGQQRLVIECFECGLLKPIRRRQEAVNVQLRQQISPLISK